MPNVGERIRIAADREIDGAQGDVERAIFETEPISRARDTVGLQAGARGRGDGDKAAFAFTQPNWHSLARWGRVMRVFGKLAFLIAVLTVALWPDAEAHACSGCGCRGGPGYRGPNGRCVGWSDIGRTCGDPPSTRCAPEGPNAGAEEAAKLGAKAIEAGKPKPGGPK